MATADDYAAWIVKNQDKKGSPEFATVAEAYRLAKSDSQTSSAVIPGTPEQPTPQETSWMDTLLGIDTGLGKMVKGAASAPIGVFGGIVKSILEGGYGTPEGAQKASGYASNFIGNAVGQPSSQGEQEFLQSAGRATQGLTPLLGLPSEMAAMSRLAGPAAQQLKQSTSEASGITFRPMAESLMESALKPTLKQHKTGEAQVAVDTLLKYGINPTKGGAEKLRSMVNDVNEQIAAQIAGSKAVVPRDTVSSYLDPVRAKFGNQVSPASDLAAIKNIADEFSLRPQNIPVQEAQALKKGTYSVLQGKYGEAGSAATEAQKALARGLKEEIANAVPEVSLLNAKDSALIKTLNVTERRALMDMNKNPMGLALLTTNPGTWAAFMADKSALFKSIVARMLNSLGTPPQKPVALPAAPVVAGPPEWSLGYGAGTFRPQVKTQSPLGDLTPDWTTSPGVGATKEPGISAQGMFRLPGEDALVSSRARGRPQMPVQPGIPGLDDVAISGEAGAWTDIAPGALARLKALPDSPAKLAALRRYDELVRAGVIKE